MRIARKLMLLALVAIAAMAFGVSTASATVGQLQITDQAGVPCSDWSEGGPGGCTWHAEGEAHLFGHLFGIESQEAECHLEVEGRVDADGVGEIQAVTVTPGAHDPNCATVVQICNLHWLGEIEEFDTGASRLTGYVCFDPSETGSRCEGQLTVPITETGTTEETQHLSVLDTKPAGAGSFCELDLDLETEHDEHDGLHLRHL